MSDTPLPYRGVGMTPPDNLTPGERAEWAERMDGSTTPGFFRRAALPSGGAAPSDNAVLVAALSLGSAVPGSPTWRDRYRIAVAAAYAVDFPPLAAVAPAGEPDDGGIPGEFEPQHIREPLAGQSLRMKRYSYQRHTEER